MKRIVETNDGGFEAMLGERIELWCGVYIYVGKLVGVNDNHLELEDAGVVYETGPLSDPQYKDMQPRPGKLRVMLQAIESWGDAR